jgi:hypothetical protein
VNTIKGQPEHAEAERADGAGGGRLGRRNVLGGLAALPVLSRIGSATPPLAAPATRPGSVPKTADDLARGEERRYNAPLLAPTVDASLIPERGAPTRIAILSGFSEGWYELIHASGRADRVTWDAGRLPVLWIHGEFGTTRESPYHDRFYTLALQPMSRNPYPRSTAIL